MPVSSIATHPQRDKIIAALVAKQSYRTICEWANPPVTTGSLSRFNRASLAELRGTVAKQAERQAERAETLPYNDTEHQVRVTPSVQRAAMASASSPFRARLEQLWQRTDRSLDRAETAVRVTMDKDSGEYLASGADVACIAPLLSQAHKNLELLGRATRELADGDTSVTNVLVVCSPTAHVESTQPDPEPLTIDIGQK